MIFYLVTKGTSGAMTEYVKSWGSTPGSRMQFLFYEDLLEIKSLQAGTYIFSDLEILSPSRLELAQHLWHTLSATKPHDSLLNNPFKVLRRYKLLCELADRGKNRFRLVRATDSLDSLRFPVFIREERHHSGNLTPLLYSRHKLVRALKFLVFRGFRRGDLLVVEFCDTSDSEGVFRKYSAFIVGSIILPRHLIFSRHWNVKKPDLVVPALEQEQEEYLAENPHRGWLIDMFKFSGIEYGRIDYSILHDEPQIWEINTNPTVHKLTPRLTSAFETIDWRGNSEEIIPFSIEPKLKRAIKNEERQLERTKKYRKVVESVASNRFVRPFVPMVKRLARLEPNE